MEYDSESVTREIQCGRDEELGEDEEGEEGEEGDEGEGEEEDSVKAHIASSHLPSMPVI